MVEKLDSYFDHGFYHWKEPVVVRFSLPAVPVMSPFTAFSINFTNGASRALAALILVETAMTSGFTPDTMTSAEIECMRSMLYITATSEGPSPKIETLISQVVFLKQAKSQTQRLDALQYLECFLKAVQEQRLLSSNLESKSDVDLLCAVIAGYNKSCTLSACKVDGAEKQAIMYLSEYGEEVRSIVRQCWNDYKVRDSPINKALLATKLLGRMVPCEAASCWEEAMKPTKEKLPVLFNRLCTGFAAKVTKAMESQIGPVNLRNSGKRFKEELTDDLFFSCMCWSHWTPQLKSIMTDSKWERVNNMFCRGSLDIVVTSAIRNNDPHFKAMPGFHCRAPTHFCPIPNKQFSPQVTSLPFCSDVEDISSDTQGLDLSTGEAHLEKLKTAVALEVFALKEFQQKRALLASSSGF